MARKDRARLILCSGKGGVGKSTVAAAVATHFAEQGKNVLLVSSDPAHSLSGIFDKEIGGKVTKMDKNLHVIELDIQKISESVERKYRKIFADSLASWIDEDIIKDLPLEMISGVDEIFALDQVRKYVDDKYDLIVWDTAPTGYTLRLLNLSEKISKALSGKLATYMKLAHPIQTIKAWLGKGNEPEIVAAFKELGKSTRKIRDMLASGKTEFIFVLNPEKLSIIEADQLLKAAESHNLTIKRAVINKLLVPCDCEFCSLKRKEQEANMKIINEKYKDLKILTVPYLPHDVISKKRIKEYSKKLMVE